MKLSTYLAKFDLLERVKEAADDELYALLQWDFAINYRAKSRFGCCHFDKRLVEVTNEYYIHGEVKEEEYDDFINTLLHETAHAIVHERYGTHRFGHFGRKIQPHGREWKMVMRNIGITNIKRCGSSEVLKEKRAKSAKHTYTCKDCEHVISTQRRLKNVSNKYHVGCRRKPNGGALVHRQMR